MAASKVKLLDKHICLVVLTNAHVFWRQKHRTRLFKRVQYGRIFDYICVVSYKCAKSDDDEGLRKLTT